MFSQTSFRQNNLYITNIHLKPELFLQQIKLNGIILIIIISNNIESKIGESTNWLGLQVGLLCYFSVGTFTSTYIHLNPPGYSNFLATTTHTVK